MNKSSYRVKKSSEELAWLVGKTISSVNVNAGMAWVHSIVFTTDGKVLTLEPSKVVGIDIRSS
jgi:hypothetical protein